MYRDDLCLLTANFLIVLFFVSFKYGLQPPRCTFRNRYDKFATGDFNDFFAQLATVRGRARRRYM